MSTDKKKEGYRNRGVTKRTTGSYNSLIIQKNGIVRMKKITTKKKRRT